MAATTLLASCSKEQGNNAPTGDATNVSIKIEKPVISRAEETAVGTPQVSFTSGTLYLTTSSGQIRRYHPLSNASNGDLGVNGSNLQISAMELAAGTSLTNVPSDVANIYIIGNAPSTLPTTGMIDVVLATLADSESQYDGVTVGGGIGNVTLYGTNTLTVVDADNKSASLYVFPICARIEIAGVSVGGSVTGLDLNGVFVNNYYASMPVNAALGTLTPTNHGPGGTLIYGDNTTEYPTASVWLKDWSATGFTGNAPAAGKVWAYNVLAPGTFDNAAGTTAAAVGADTPHIILSISNILPATLGLTGTQFVTVNKFVDAGDGITEVTGLKPGCVYTISAANFVITENEPGVEAETSKVTVKVTITPFTWTTQAIKPSF